jgi:hypothetical protein
MHAAFSVLMSTATDLRTLAANVMRDGDTDLAAFFGHFAHDCRFVWANETPAQGPEDIQALVGRMLAGVSGLRHDIIEQPVGEERRAAYGRHLHPSGRRRVPHAGRHIHALPRRAHRRVPDLPGPHTARSRGRPMTRDAPSCE